MRCCGVRQDMDRHGTYEFGGGGGERNGGRGSSAKATLMVRDHGPLLSSMKLGQSTGRLSRCFVKSFRFRERLIPSAR